MTLFNAIVTILHVLTLERTDVMQSLDSLTFIS